MRLMALPNFAWGVPSLTYKFYLSKKYSSVFLTVKLQKKFKHQKERGVYQKKKLVANSSAHKLFI